MSILRRAAGWIVGPIEVENTVAPADIVPGFMVVTPEAVELEHHARHVAALRHVHAVLEEESAKAAGFRNVGRFDLALELRSILLPSAAGSEVLREVAPVGVRYPAPVAPGRAS